MSPQGPASRREWRPDIAYAVGLLVTDGHLSIDRRHIVLVSADLEQLETFRDILGLKNSIGRHSPGELRIPAHRIQFGDRLFYDWLTTIGFRDRKTYTIGPLNIPDELFPDFLRGHLDGDGSITAYVDSFNARLNPRYVYQRLYVRFLSASRAHIDWLREKIVSLRGISGYVSVQKPRRDGYAAIHTLHFAKKEAISLLRWMYYAPDVPCLARKRLIAEPYLTGNLRDFRHPICANSRKRRTLLT